MRCLLPTCCCVPLLCLAQLAQADPAATGGLSMRVRDGEGKPLVGVRLTLQPSGRVTMTDEKGAAVFVALPAGKYVVSLAPAGYHSVTTSITLIANPDNLLALTLAKLGPPPPPPPPEYLVTPPVSPGSGRAWRAAQEIVLREAAFRHLFAVSPYARRYSVYYLSVQGFPWGQGVQSSKDPDAVLLARFRGSTPPVQAVSALPVSGKDWNNPRRHPWIIFRVTSIHWTSDTSVEIDAGAAQAGYLSSDNSRLTCELRDGWWEITGITWVSV